MSDSELAVVSPESFATPTIITRAGQTARKKFFEFFTVPIRNANTRAAYYRAIQQFLAWAERAGYQDPRAHRCGGQAQTTAQTSRITGALFASLISGDRHYEFSGK